MWSPRDPPSCRRRARITLTLAGLAVLLLLISGPGTRADWWPFRVGFGMFAGALLIGLAAAGAAVVGLVSRQQRAHSGPILVAALVLGAASAAVPLDYVRRIKVLPYINDITTDPERPPQFSPPRIYQSHFAELQRIGYPGLRPLELPLAPGQAFARAAEIARERGWDITALEERGGRIEAVATTRWFGFRDDVVIRITPAGAGSRIDMRSRSRVGRSDVGTNARRIEEFLARMAR